MYQHTTPSRVGDVTARAAARRRGGIDGGGRRRPAASRRAPPPHQHGGAAAARAARRRAAPRQPRRVRRSGHLQVRPRASFYILYKYMCLSICFINAFSRGKYHKMVKIVRFNRAPNR